METRRQTRATIQRECRSALQGERRAQETEEQKRLELDAARH